MATKRQVLAALAAVGGTLDTTGADYGRWTIDAPAGHRWTATGDHAITTYDDGDRAATWEAILEDVAYGVEPCSGYADGLDDGPPCGYCASGGDDHRGVWDVLDRMAERDR